MRKISVIVALLCCLAAPVLAEETSEATATRVHENEKANVVLQEDLARTEVTLNKTRIDLKKATVALDDETKARKVLEAQLADEIAARKALMDTLTQVKTQLATEIATRADELKAASAADNAALNAKLDALTKALADQAATNAKEVAAMRLAMEKEHADRLASETDANKARKKLAKDNNTTRIIMGALSAVFGVIAIVK